MEGSESRESRMRFEFYTLIVFLHLLTSLNFFLSYAASSGNSNGVCVSMGGRFPPYSNHGKPPRGVNKGPNDLTLCRVFRKKTCCDVSQTHPAFISIRKLASTGEANQDCLQLWELLECSICDPQVGVQPGPPVICASFCEKVYAACSKAYFSMDTTLQALTPCGVNDFVCGRASEWISNGTELCRAAGFAVNPFDDSNETSCYGGKARLDAIADTWAPSRYKGQRGTEYSGVLKDFQHWVREMPSYEKVSWAVAGMVLTAGILFKSRRRRRGQHHIQAAIQRNARLKNLDRQNVKPRSPVGKANRMGTGR